MERHAERARRYGIPFSPRYSGTGRSDRHPDSVDCDLRPLRRTRPPRDHRVQAHRRRRRAPLPRVRRQRHRPLPARPVRREPCHRLHGRLPDRGRRGRRRKRRQRIPGRQETPRKPSAPQRESDTINARRRFVGVGEPPPTNGRIGDRSASCVFCSFGTDDPKPNAGECQC